WSSTAYSEQNSIKKPVPLGQAFCLQRLQEFAHAGAGFAQVVHRIGIRDAHMPFAALAERAAGYDCDLLLAEQAFAEFLGGKPGRDNGREHIERALRLKAGQPHRAELAEQEAAA